MTLDALFSPLRAAKQGPQALLRLIEMFARSQRQALSRRLNEISKRLSGSDFRVGKRNQRIEFQLKSAPKS